MPRKSGFEIHKPFAGGEKRRPARVADLIRNEIATLLIRKVKDPRLQGITVTSVTVTDDLRSARILYNCGDDNAVDVSEGLQSVRGFFRSHLARELGLRFAPDLFFKRDPALKYLDEMEKIFKEIKQENEA